MHLIVMAKAPEPGRVKTRLCPPCTVHEAADLAEAALADTLASAMAAAPGCCVLALDGTTMPWLPDDVTVIPQRGEDLADRLEHAWMEAGPGLVMGMDTPQVSPHLLAGAIALIDRHDAVFGPATDGGWWAVGADRVIPGLFRDVPTSRPHTGARQLARLREQGFEPASLPVLRDVDTIADAHAVAREAVGTRFADRLARLPTAGAAR